MDSYDPDEGVFRSAIKGTDGAVDAGYLAAYVVMIAVVGAIPAMCLLAAWALYLNPLHTLDVQALGVGIGAVCGGFGVALAAVGAFRWGDKEKVKP